MMQKGECYEWLSNENVSESISHHSTRILRGHTPLSMRHIMRQICYVASSFMLR